MFEYLTSFDNGGEFNQKAGADSRNFTIYDGSNTVQGLSAEITGLLSIFSNPEESPGLNRREDKLHIELPANGYVWLGDNTGSSRGTSTRDINGNVLTVDDLVSTTVPLWNADFTEMVTSAGFIRRNSDGTFDLGDFLILEEGAVSGNVGSDFE